MPIKMAFNTIINPLILFNRFRYAILVSPFLLILIILAITYFMPKLYNFIYTLLVALGLHVSYSCDGAPSVTNQQKPNNTANSSQKMDTLPSTLPKASWRNPVMSPVGADVARIIRGYYLVGDFDKMLQFVIIPPCYTRKQIEYILRKATWGYEIKFNNLQWMEDSTFILNVRTNRQNTVDAEQYVGRIINDTAKLFLFPEKENLFPYYGDEDLEDPCQLKDLLDKIYFAFDKTTILPKSSAALKALVNYLTYNPSLNAHFIGHSSAEGSKAYNKALSEGRAKAICDYLIQHGISKNRLSYEGKGDTQPLAKNDTEANKSLNRRVELVLSKNINIEER
jgi:outer membrane protein OmpA-like peptidoglycan-associated protein